MSESNEIQDPVLGTIRRRPEFTFWEASVSLCGKEHARVLIDPENAESIDDLIAFAREIVGFVEHSEAELRNAIVDELLDVYKEQWPEQADVTEEEFFRALSFSGIRIHKPCSELTIADVCYQSGLFLEQLPIVHLGDDMTIQGASLE